MEWRDFKAGTIKGLSALRDVIAQQFYLASFFLFAFNLDVLEKRSLSKVKKQARSTAECSDILELPSYERMWEIKKYKVISRKRRNEPLKK